MAPDQIIQNYKLIKFLGDGGMGQVWLAEHTLLGRQVAIKSLHQQFLRSQSIRDRFKQEAATLAHLHHPGIVSLHDYIEEDESAYLVMEYVEGVPLDEYIQAESGPIPDAQLRQLFGQILEGFAYAHQKGVVHRDIKPGNFLFTKEGKVKVLDFGIAKILGEGDRKLTKTGTQMGTVLYMSPEQVKGETIDQRSDIYSLGITLFQMATGVFPYPQDTTEFYIYDQIVNHPLPEATHFYPGVTPHIEAIIAKATQKLPENRYQTCDEFLKALRNPAPPAPTIETPQKTTAQVFAPVAEPEPPILMVAEKIAGPTFQPTSTPTQPEKKKRAKWPILVLLLFLLGGGATILFLFVLPGDPKKDGLYVIASSLFLRTSPNDEADYPSKIPYGTMVEVKSRPKQGWAEIEQNGKSYYVVDNYLVDYKTFLELDHIGTNPDAKELMRESYLKLAIRDYFIKNGYRADIPNGEYQEVYGEEPNSEKIWFVKGEPQTEEYNSVIPTLNLEKESVSSKKWSNAAVLIQNKANPTVKRLVTFRFVTQAGNVQSTEIGSQELNDCGNCLMKAIDNKEVFKNWDTSRTDKNKLSGALANGKNGILLVIYGTDIPPSLLIWERLNKFSSYILQYPYSDEYD